MTLLERGGNPAGEAEEDPVTRSEEDPVSAAEEDPVTRSEEDPVSAAEEDPGAESEKEALIKEARRLRRRRWMFGSAFTALALGAGAGGFLVASGPPSAAHHAAPPSGSSAPGSLASARSAVPTRSPDLLQPGALATLPDGKLLILDSSRDQILELGANGDLTVFAGTGRLGFSGDRGPARDAELDLGYAGSAGMTVTPSGAVDFLDDGGCRIRQVSPGGSIRTIFRGARRDRPGRAGCPFTAIAVSPTGHLYVATSSQVERVSPSGRLVWVAGSSRSSDYEPTHPTRSNVALEPDALAFNRAGDLFISSFALKLVYELTPSGKLTDLGESYADQFALEPDGEMLAGTHEGVIQAFTPAGIKPFYEVVPKRVAGINWGRDQGFQEDGIAVTGTGTIYADNSQGNGYGDGTVLVRITPSKHASLAPIHTPLAATLPRVGAPGFPVSVYPAARASRGTELRSCPSDAGLMPFNAAAITRAKAVARTYLTGLFAADIAATDRSWWTQAFSKVAGGDISSRHVVTGEAAASKSPIAASLRQACGRQLVDDSVTVTVGNPPYSDFNGSFYLLDRNGHPLVYDAR